MNRREFFGLAGGSLVAITAPIQIARAQDWPQRPVKFIVPLGAGSALDIAARLIADRLSSIWHKPVVVENRPGADAIVGISAVVSAHDDHVLLYGGSTLFNPQPFMHENLPYDARRDLVPIAGITVVSVSIAASQSLDVKSVAGLVELIRKEPGKLNWGAIAPIDDLVFSAFLKKEGLSMPRVPYRDPVSALNDLSEGRIDVTLAALALTLPRVQTGKVKLLALTNPRRSPIVPDVPTVAEAGYPSLGYDPVNGLFGPSNLTARVRRKISVDLQTIASDPSLEARLKPTGQVVRFLPTAELVASIDAERAKLTEIAKLLGGRPGTVTAPASMSH
jgi:tripartite-type tricarboxylate transporter receptor subunit TctC